MYMQILNTAILTLINVKPTHRFTINAKVLRYYQEVFNQLCDSPHLCLYVYIQTSRNQVLIILQSRCLPLILTLAMQNCAPNNKP